MNKKLLNLILGLLIIIVLGIVIYKNSLKIKTANHTLTVNYPYVDASGWTITNDCKDIKLNLVKNDTSESGLANERDIAVNEELKIVSIGLPESLYGSRKRVEVSYANQNDYTDCSLDVKGVIDSVLDNEQRS